MTRVRQDITDCANCPLRRLDAFDRLSGEELRFMQRFKVGELRIGAGTPILMEGTTSPQLYTVLEGFGLRQKSLPNGRRQVVNFVLPGDFVGLQAGVMGEMRHAVDATTEMVLCVFDRTELWSLFQNQPARAFDLTWLAAIEEHLLGEAMTSIGQLSARERLSWALLRFHGRCAALGLADGPRCPFPFTQQDLADALGLSLVHTNRTLARLRGEQLVACEGGEIRLLDGARLAEVAMTERPSVAPRPLI